jgi:type VI secretion system protein VasD
MYRRLLTALVIAFVIAPVTAAVLAASGCATTADRPTQLKLTIVIAADANPDDTGRPSPVVLGVFDLVRPERFRNADYLGLLSAPEKNLRSDLIDTHRTKAIAPGSQQELTLTLDAQTRHVGIVAELLQFSRAKTRISIPLDQLRATELKLTVDADGVAISDAKKTSSTISSRFNDD